MHRYASDAAVIFGLLHGWRTFFQDRFRGPRWLAWVTGVGMAVVTWFIGITGYWLIWDARTQLLNQSLFNILGGSKSGQAFIVYYMIGDAAGNGWIFMKRRTGWACTPMQPCCTGTLSPMRTGLII